MDKFSIIVPVYNVEKYLTKCLDSITNQNFRDIEIICVNDGSTDNSLQILKEYAQKDRRIIVIDQENQGVSAARNRGLAVATGDYILFVDSDDWIELNACEIILQNLEEKNVDILFFEYRKISKNNKEYPLKKTVTGDSDVFNFNTKLDYCFFNLDLRSVWGKVYKKSYINSLGKFSHNISFGEDTLFIIDKLLNNPRVKIIRDILYNYRDSEKSLTKISQEEQFQQLNLLISEYDKIFNNNDNLLKLYSYDDTYYIYSFLWNVYIDKNNNFLEEALEFYKNFDTTIVKSLKGYNALKLNLFLKNKKLLFLYWVIIRPICKHFIVLPLRKIQNLRRNNEK